jgi:hypothetical protein
MLSNAGDKSLHINRICKFYANFNKDTGNMRIKLFL